MAGMTNSTNALGRGAILLGALLFSGLFAMVGCSGEDVGDCPPNSAQRQANGGLVLTNKCITCHSSKTTGPARGGAPEEYNFDDQEKLKDEAEVIYGEAKEGTMPPGAPLSGAELEDLRIHLACLPE
jgi:mono/diheme cytochrome c family protein